MSRGKGADVRSSNDITRQPFLSIDIKAIRQYIQCSMPSQSKVYIAGVGCSPSPPEGPPVKAVLRSLVSAATKALLDAGVTYDDITQCVRSKTLSYASEVFKALDERESPVDDVEGGSELDSSIRWVRDQGAQCVLMIAVEKVCL